PPRTTITEWYIGIPEAYEGRILLRAGQFARAAPLLENSAQSCQGLDAPFLNVRTRLWLGVAREGLGDHDGACSAYRSVVDQWGNAKPSSVTAAEAARRSRALGCQK
ncbi:MAG TPA: tetratricopeptide repeat protein, partial [Polyangiaceae bacterium]|nr:tetratricopeptide repeat protein [Polyangiaceae bacterium]